MPWDTIKSLVLSVWGRYSVSWIAKALATYLGYDAATAQSTGSQIALGLGSLAVVIADAIHSKMTATQTATKAVEKSNP